MRENAMADEPKIVIYTSPSQGKGFAASPGKEEALDAIEALHDLGKQVGQASRNFWSTLVEGGSRPSQVELSLELTIEGKGKWVIVEAGASVKASVKVTWNSGQQG